MDATAQSPDFRRSGAWRTALSWAVLIAFALQAYVTQTHFHRPPNPPTASAKAVQAPAPDERSELVCPLCQATAAAGAFVGSALAALEIPTVQAETDTLPAAVARPAIAAAGFNWRSRAPPQP